LSCGNRNVTDGVKEKHYSSEYPWLYTSDTFHNDIVWVHIQFYSPRTSSVPLSVHLVNRPPQLMTNRWHLLGLASSCSH